MTARKITGEQARQARVAYHVDRVPSRTLRATLGLSVCALHRILTGQTYKNAGGPVMSAAERAAADRAAPPALVARIAELEARCADLQFALDELMAPLPAFADLGLSPMQLRLAGALLRRPGMVLTHDQLLAAGGSDSRVSISVHIRRLRRRVPALRIESQSGIGYRARLEAMA